jgi:environmental stress-induced protein Ves
MDVIRLGDYRRMRWRNGLGETAEIVVSPQYAALDHFDWRISMARVEAAGPFSSFPGIDRTLTVLDGEGFRLAIDEHPAIQLTPRSAPFAFRGDSAASTTLLGGAVTDLNVMTRRGNCWHRVRRFAAGEPLSLAATAVAAVVFCVAGTIRVTAAGTVVELGALDTLLIDEPCGALATAEGAPDHLLLVEIGRL